ncbi:MAG: hypothetical protein M1837_006652 [Sclerophora amabilis]|nr:MAG: hypothetical protein M1837_006652 [Sclerophora amabilis]
MIILGSAAPNNTINLELAVDPLHRALRSALSASSASLRLTKRDNDPVLSLTITTSTISNGSTATRSGLDGADGFGIDEGDESFRGTRDRETVVTQDVHVRVLDEARVEGIHEPRCREPEVHILLPSLLQLKSISERFTKLASTSSTSSSGITTFSIVSPKLELSANMHGSLRLKIATDALSISSVWNGLSNPELDPTQVDGGEEGIRNHPATRMRELGAEDSLSEESWAKVRIDGKDWGRVLSVGRLGGRVIACTRINGKAQTLRGIQLIRMHAGFVHDHALILYVYLPNEDENAEESVLTVSDAVPKRRYKNADMDLSW